MPVLPDAKIVLRLDRIDKSFGAVHALKGIDLEVTAGEVVAIVGDNGAGKSTLIQTIGGVRRPDSGDIYVDGVQYRHLTATTARDLGIETIHQHLALVDSLDVTANVFINRERVHTNRLGRALGWLDKRGMRAECARALEAFGLPPTIVRRPVRQLSGGQRQMVAIARALYWQPRIVMMDEPTAALAVAHAARVLDVVRSLAANGIAVLFVSHDVQHVLQVSDRVTVLRQGEKIADLDTASTTHQEIVMYITGHHQTRGDGDAAVF